MVEETQRQACRHCQTDDIEANFDFGVRNARNIGQLPGKQVRGDDGQLAAVGERNAQADQAVAHHKIHHPHGNVVGQDVDPGLMHIQQLAEYKAHHKAEQVAGHKLFAQQHQAEHQAPLEQVGPGAQREHGPHLGKGKGHTGNSRNARPGIEHQHHAKAVHQHGNAQCQFAAEQRQRF